MSFCVYVGVFIRSPILHMVLLCTTLFPFPVQKGAYATKML